MATEALADLLACVAHFGRSLDDSCDPSRFLAEFSARKLTLDRTCGKSYDSCCADRLV
jgi:hypothetical protein